MGNLNFINKVYDFCFVILLLVLPFSLAIPNILLIPLFFLLFFKIKEIKTVELYWIVLALLVFYQILKSIYFNSLIKNIHHHLPFLLLLSTSFLLQQSKKKYLLIKSFVLGTFASCLVSYIRIFLFFLEHKKILLGNHKEVFELLTIHRPYIGFMVLCSIVLCDYLLKKKKINRKLFYSFSIFFIVFLFVIAARLALLIMLFFLVIRIYQLRKKNKKIMLTVFIFVVLGLCFNNNLKSRFHIQDNLNKTIEVLKNQEPRFVIWNCAFEVNESIFNPIFGYKSYSEIQKQLNFCYGSTIKNLSKRNYYTTTSFNTHNQFFDFYLRGGVISLILFLTVLTLIILKAKNNFNVLFLVFASILFLFVENVFSRQVGVYLFGFLLFLVNCLTYENK